MQYMFYRWRARQPQSNAWKELGWCMTEEDARKWAAESGHEIERIAGQDPRPQRAFGGTLG